MAPRRPSTAGDTDSRMPFAAAEALLWGPEMKQQHAHLLTEMRALQMHHEAYDARIRAAERAAEAAEAATSRVRHLEQQLAAIEAEDDDKAFEKWAVGEMTRLGIFVDTNKHIKQKQIELDSALSHAVEDLDKLGQVPRDLKDALRRLDLLETGRNQDARRIKNLEQEVTRLNSIRLYPTSNTIGPQTVSIPPQGIIKSTTPSLLLNAEISEATTETDDEDLIPVRKITHAEIQVPQSPEIREKNLTTACASSVTLGSPVKSARQRLMQRPSIHDSILPQQPEEQRQIRTPVPLPSNIGYGAPVVTQLLSHNRQSRPPAVLSTREAPSHDRVSPPPTQLLPHGRSPRAPAPVSAPTRKPQLRARVAPAPTKLINRVGPRKRKLPEKEPQTQRMTRAQAKRNQEQETEERKPPGAGNSPVVPPTQLVGPVVSSRKKQKTAHVPGSDQVKAKSSTATRIAHRAPAKTKRSSAAGSSKSTAMEPTQLVIRSPSKWNVPKATMSPVNKRNFMSGRPNAVSQQKQKSLIVILRSPQKATGIEHGKSDDMQITAADRVKMSPRKAAAAPASRFKAIPKPSSARNTTSQTKPDVGASGSGGRSNAARMKPEISEFDDF